MEYGIFITISNLKQSSIVLGTVVIYLKGGGGGQNYESATSFR